MGNVGIKFKEFVYTYNFTCFELIGMDLKSHGKCKNQKKLFNFLHKTNFNTELQESNSINLANIICLHINSINQYIYIYIYIYTETSCGKHEILPTGTLYDIFLI